MRKYIGFWTDGHDFGEFYYYYIYRNFSKLNMEDMKKEYIKNYGYKSFFSKTFSFGYLVD